MSHALVYDLDDFSVIAKVVLRAGKAVVDEGELPDDIVDRPIWVSEGNVWLQLTPADGETWLRQWAETLDGRIAGVLVADALPQAPLKRHYPGGHDHDQSKHGKGGGAEAKTDWASTKQSLNPENDVFAWMPGVALREALAAAELTQAEKDALLSYQRGSYSLNSVLRHGRTSDWEGQADKPEDLARIHDLADVIESTIQEKGLVVDKPQFVWRGVDGPSFTGLSTGFKRLIGKVVEDEGFLSTIPYQHGIDRFGTIDLRIKVLDGTRYIELTGDSEGTEWLFPRGSRLYIEDYFPRTSTRRPTFYVTLLRPKT